MLGRDLKEILRDGLNRGRLVDQHATDGIGRGIIFVFRFRNVRHPMGSHSVSKIFRMLAPLALRSIVDPMPQRLLFAPVSTSTAAISPAW
jgi:hypothetical protein